MKTLAIIGCGAVGRTLGRLFHEASVFQIGDVVNRSPESAQAAVQFMGAGRAVATLAELQPAEVYLVGAADDAVAGLAAALAACGVIGPGTIAFHVSGALSSSALAPLASRGAALASVHPVRSFADPLESARSFAGTWCGLEGDAEALATLEQAFSGIGGRTFPVEAKFKTIYHAGSVLVCNYLTALVEAGVKAYGKGGLPRSTALEVMEPLVRGTVDNIFRVGVAQALTGPIARGDCATVSHQVAALEQWDGELAQLYRVLGRIAVELSAQRGVASAQELADLRKILEEG